MVIDYKTGKSAPTGSEAVNSPQLGLYQLAVMNGAVGRRPEPEMSADPEDPAAVAPELNGSAGAALLHLRKGVTRNQPPLTVEADGRTWVHDLLEDLVTAIASESFPARRNDGCEKCQVRRSCPARPEGAQVV